MVYLDVKKLASVKRIARMNEKRLSHIKIKEFQMCLKKNIAIRVREK